MTNKMSEIQKEIKMKKKDYYWLRITEQQHVLYFVTKNRCVIHGTYSKIQLYINIYRK